MRSKAGTRRERGRTDEATCTEPYRTESVAEPPAEGDVRGRVPISSHSEVTVHLSPPWKSAGGSMSAEVAKPKAICIPISIPPRWGPGHLPHRPPSATGSTGATSID